MGLVLADAIQEKKKQVMATLDKRNPTPEQRRLFRDLVDLVLKYGTEHEKLESLKILEKFSKHINFDQLIDNYKFFVEKTGKNAHLGIWAFLNYSCTKTPTKLETSMLADIVNEIARERDNITQFRIALLKELFTEHIPTLTSLNKAKDLVTSVGIRDADLEVFLNFAYAIDVLGEEKTKELYKEYGITYFLRYSQRTLEELYQIYKNPTPQNRSPSKPVLLVVFNKFDEEGAFYKEGRQLDKLTKTYRIHIFEVDNENSFYDAIERIGRKEGGVDVLIIGGHGEVDKVHLGKPTESDTAELDLTDEEEIKRRWLKDWMELNSKVILISCSTGKNEQSIAALFSRILGVEKVFAPREPATRVFYHLEDGLIGAVTYKLSTSEKPEAAQFRKGTMGLLPRKIK